MAQGSKFQINVQLSEKVANNFNSMVKKKSDGTTDDQETLRIIAQSISDNKSVVSLTANDVLNYTIAKLNPMATVIAQENGEISTQISKIMSSLPNAKFSDDQLRNYFKDKRQTVSLWLCELDVAVKKELMVQKNQQSALERENNNLNQNVAQLNDANKKLTSQLKDTISAAEQFQKDLKQTREELKAANEKIATKESVIADQKQQISELNNQVSDLSRQIRGKDAAITALEVQKARLAQDLQQAKEAIAKQQTENDQLTQQLAEQKKEIEKQLAEKEVKHKQAIADKEAKHKHAFAAQDKKHQGELKERDNKITQKEKENQALKEENKVFADVKKAYDLLIGEDGKNLDNIARVLVRTEFVVSNGESNASKQVKQGHADHEQVKKVLEQLARSEEFASGTTLFGAFTTLKATMGVVFHDDAMFKFLEALKKVPDIKNAMEKVRADEQSKYHKTKNNMKQLQNIGSDNKSQRKKAGIKFKNAVKILQSNGKGAQNQNDISEERKSDLPQSRESVRDTQSRLNDGDNFQVQFSNIANGEQLYNRDFKGNIVQRKQGFQGKGSVGKSKAANYLPKI